MTPRVRQIQMAWRPSTGGPERKPMLVGLDEDGQTMWFWDWFLKDWVVLEKVDEEGVK